MPEVTMTTNFRGILKVSIEEVGTLVVDLSRNEGDPLVGYAAQAYCYLTQRMISTSVNDWELVEFDPKAGTLVVRYRPTNGWTLSL